MKTVKILAATATTLAFFSPAYAQSLSDTVNSSGVSQSGSNATTAANSASEQAQGTQLPGSTEDVSQTNQITGLTEEQLASVDQNSANNPQSFGQAPTVDDAEDILGQQIVAADNVIIGTIVEVRASKRGCPMLAVAPNSALGGKYQRVWIQANSCVMEKEAVRLSMPSTKFIRTIRN